MKKLLSWVSLVLLFAVISGFVGCNFKSEATPVSEAKSVLYVGTGAIYYNSLNQYALANPKIRKISAYI